MAAAAEPISPDILSQLLEASWRGISFPTLLVSTKGGHGLVMHKRVDRNGWRVENTGLDGYTHELKIPFVNTLARGPNETWADLYPITYRKMLGAVEDRTTGVFQHPELGQRTCKVGPFSTTLDPDFRGGTVLQLSLVETVDDGDAIALSDTSVMPIAAAAAADLDALFLPLNPPPDTGTPGGMSLSKFIRSIGSIADEWNLFVQQIEADVNKVTNALEVLGEKFGAVPGFSDKTNRLISALHAYRFRVLLRDKPTGHYIVPRPTTVAAIARRLGTTVPDLIKLNRNLAAGPIVPAQTSVRYYG